MDSDFSKSTTVGTESQSPLYNKMETNNITSNIISSTNNSPIMSFTNLPNLNSPLNMLNNNNNNNTCNINNKLLSPNIESQTQYSSLLNAFNNNNNDYLIPLNDETTHNNNNINDDNTILLNDDDIFNNTSFNQINTFNTINTNEMMLQYQYAMINNALYNPLTSNMNTFLNYNNKLKLNDNNKYNIPLIESTVMDTNKKSKNSGNITKKRKKKRKSKTNSNKKRKYNEININIKKEIKSEINNKKQINSNSNNNNNNNNSNNNDNNNENNILNLLDNSKDDSILNLARYDKIPKSAFIGIKTKNGEIKIPLPKQTSDNNYEIFGYACEDKIEDILQPKKRTRYVRGLTEDEKKTRRREQNRNAAARSRARKNAMIAKVIQLHLENKGMRACIANQIDELKVKNDEIDRLKKENAKLTELLALQS